MSNRDPFGKAFGLVLFVWVLGALASVGLTVAFIWGLVTLVNYFTSK